MSIEKDSKFEALLDHIKRSRGLDFGGYKRSTLMRRVFRRMQMVGIENYVDYMDFLQVHPEEFTQLFNTILINVTAFFRDEPAWTHLAERIIPKILESKSSNDFIRVWSAGCASGEEAYTLAMLLAEALGPEAFQRRVKIYATDMDEDALAQARQASYTEKAMETVPVELRMKYFEIAAGRYVFRPEFRRSVIFGRHDLLQDAPISRLDLLACRNTLMYFNAETQEKILARLHFALKDGGFLFLGKAEMLLTHANLFTAVEFKHRIFTKAAPVNVRDRLLIMAQAGDAEAAGRLGQHERLREVAFETGPVAQVVVDINGALALANERARSLFGLSQKDVGSLLHDLKLAYQPVQLRMVIEQAYAERHSVKLTSAERHFPDGSLQYLDVQASPLLENGKPLGVSITYEDVTQRVRLQIDLQRSTRELETAYEELQSANEELETTNEELQSTNEELETTNEELQSTNEELETMNEELQSTNEELETLNEEMRQRTTELNNSNIFLQAVLSNLRAGIAVVDHRLEILIWNQRAEDLWGLRADEAQGQSLLSLDIGLPVGKLPLLEVMDGKVEGMEQIVDATSRRGKAIRCHITCSPFFGPNKERLGVVIVMEEARD